MKINLISYIIIFPVCLVLLACSPDNNAAKTKLFEDQRAVLEKAKTVDNAVQQQADEARQNIEKQTQ